ncbi:hypothetical protein DFH09DRAFT_1099811 [Mycena vulgaris]|nr:hypothetical protein DFH09DRAFT_1099811 [Mycena vulgaris]
MPCPFPPNPPIHRIPPEERAARAYTRYPAVQPGETWSPPARKRARGIAERRRKRNVLRQRRASARRSASKHPQPHEYRGDAAEGKSPERIYGSPRYTDATVAGQRARTQRRPPTYPHAVHSTQSAPAPVQNDVDADTRARTHASEAPTITSRKDGGGDKEGKNEEKGGKQGGRWKAEGGRRASKKGGKKGTRREEEGGKSAPRRNERKETKAGALCISASEPPASRSTAHRRPGGIGAGEEKDGGGARRERDGRGRWKRVGRRGGEEGGREGSRRRRHKERKRVPQPPKKEKWLTNAWKERRLRTSRPPAIFTARDSPHPSHILSPCAPAKPCLLRPPLLLARVGAFGARGEEGVHEARDGGAAHVERERAEDERSGGARALELGALGCDENTTLAGSSIPNFQINLPKADTDPSATCSSALPPLPDTWRKSPAKLLVLTWNSDPPNAYKDTWPPRRFKRHKTLTSPKAECVLSNATVPPPPFGIPVKSLRPERGTKNRADILICQ